jgi:Protein of unknown function (DUF3225)
MRLVADQEERWVAMDIDLSDVVTEVKEVFARYEQALCANDLDTLDSLFWKNPSTLRYGPNGTLIGHGRISAFRRARHIGGMERQLQNTVITTFGRDFAVANTESKRPGSDRIFRQSQTWVRMPQGWCIVAAHVSDVAG